LTNEANQEALGGNYVSPAGLAIPIHNPFFTTTSGFNWTLFKGGGILHNYLQYKHSYKASAAAAKGTVNDVLDQVANDFYNLVLNEVMLQIRVKQVETTRALVLVDKDLFANGVNTQMDVLQAQYQLSQDRQQLIQQQVSRREAAVKLATSINLNPEVDLTPRDRLVAKMVLVDPKLTPGELMQIAIDNRQELRRYDELRLAAKEQLKVAKSTLFPVLTGMGEVIGSASRASNESTLLNGGTGLSTAGAGVGPASIATLPITGSSIGGKSGTMRSLFILGVDVQWNFGGLGLQQVSQIETARADARRASLEFNRSLANVYKEVRDAYLSSSSAENLIAETTDAVNYGTEELRVAEVRLKDGIGTSLDVINAERDYINALISKANAIVQYDMAQSKLLHAIGRLSVDTLTSNVPLRQ
jgi:outer membrane protein